MVNNNQINMEQEEQERKLKSLLTGQDFEITEKQSQLLETAKVCARAYVQMSNGIAVLSDLQEDVCYVYSGLFGRTLGIPEYSLNASSAFEHEIFRSIPNEDLLERHILELRFFHFLKSVPISEKTDYYATCLIHFQREGLPDLPVLHSARYLFCHANGSVWLGLCTYTPFPYIEGKMAGNIVNTRTGEIILPEQYKQYDCNLLSKRQLEILSLLAKGTGSKQIADKLYISVHTVNRHRQDILSKLNVTNTAAAVEIGLRMNLI